MLYTGYLDKKNPAFGGGFHERFVVLTVDSLHWFRRHEGEDLFGEERGHVALAVILTVRSLEEDKTIFEVQSTDGKKRQFKAENVKACEEWVTAIRSAIRLMVDASNFKRYGNRRLSLAGIKNIIEDSENNTDNADSAEVNVLLVSLYSPSHSGNEAVLARRPDWNRVICVPRVAQGDTLLISTSNGGIIKLPYSQLIDKADSGKPFEAALQNVSLASSLQMTVAVETLSLLGGDSADASGGGGDSGGAGGNGKKKSLSQQLMSLGKALTRERDASINLIMSLMVIIAGFRTLQAVGVDTSLFFVLAFILSVHNFGAIWKRVHAEDERGAQSQSLRLVLHGHTFTSPDAPIDDPADEIPQRFIDGCEGDMREARRRWDITRHWRETEGINNILREPQPHFNLIKQMYPHYNAGRGKEGNIIFWDRPGECNLAQLAARGVGLPEMVRHFLFNTEYQWEIIEKGSQTSKSIAVLDVKGVSMSDLAGSNLDFVKQTVSIANQHYPERSFAIVVVNAPFFASMAWKIIKPWVHPNTQKKVKILSASETLNGLREIINDDQIPLYYGGSWTCGDGSKDCVRFYAPEVQEQAEYVRRLNEGTLPPPNSAQEESERGEAPPGVAGEAAGSISTAESNVEELGMPLCCFSIQ